uniref:Uncharacterized protein n=1 Tax=Oryza meridionalis TaxID=40149 RepID=A0A0E0D802_9ORYZ
MSTVCRSEVASKKIGSSALAFPSFGNDLHAPMAARGPLLASDDEFTTYFRLSSRRSMPQCLYTSPIVQG